MAVKTFYFKNVTVNGALSLQDGGTAPTGALTATGWTVAKLASPNFSLQVVGSKSTTFSSTDALTTPSLTAGSSWRSENPLSGDFANTNWSLAFRIRASAAASAQTGAVKVRIWKSANANGSGATQLTSAILTGTTTAALSTTVSATSTVTWTPGSVKSFNNEYLFVQCEWSIVVASGSNSGDALFYVESAGAITTSDFSPYITAALAVTEAPDVAAFPGGTVAWNAALATTETPDVAAFNIALEAYTTLAVTEAPDVAAFTGDVSSALSGSLVVTEAPDVAAFTGQLGLIGTLSVTEAPDVASFPGGKVAWNAVLATSEAPDVAAFPNGKVAWNAALAASETPDTASFTALGSAFGPWASTEAPDVGAFGGSVAWSAVLAASEAKDTAAFAVLVTDPVLASFAITEPRDSAAFSGYVTDRTVLLAASEAPDVASFRGRVYGLPLPGKLEFGYSRVIARRRL